MKWNVRWRCRKGSEDIKAELGQHKDSKSHVDVLETANLDSLYDRFREVLANNYFSYRDKALNWEKETIFNHAKEIADIADTFFSLVTKYKPVKEEMAFFLQFDDPLHAISQFGPFENIQAAMKMLYDNREELMEEVFEAPMPEPESPVSSIRERLQNALHEVKTQKAAEKTGEIDVR